MTAPTITAAEYARKAGLRIALYTALTFGFPILVHWLETLSNCGAGTCSTIYTNLNLYAKPVFHLAFTISLMRISRWRMRDIAWPANLGIIIPILVLADIGLVVATGSITDISLVLARPLAKPWFLMLALACVIALSLAGSDEETGRSFHEPSLIERFTLALFFPVLVSAFISILTGPLLFFLEDKALPIVRMLYMLDLRAYLGYKWGFLPILTSMMVITSAMLTRGGAEHATRRRASIAPSGPQGIDRLGNLQRVDRIHRIGKYQDDWKEKA